jgi:hypothetical protein
MIFRVRVYVNSGYLSTDQLLELFRWVSIVDEKERGVTPCSFPTAARGGSSLVKDSVIFKDRKWKKEILRLFGIGTGVGLKADKPKVCILHIEHISELLALILYGI